MALGDNDEVRAILQELCDVTHMGFCAVARVTDTRWITVQCLDRLEFGLNPGDELELKTTICDEIRQSGERVIIDDVDGNIDWQMHHTPMMYGFKSYVSVPLFGPDGAFFGTLCAIDPMRRPLSAKETVAAVEGLARRTEVVIAAHLASGGAGG
ncbi:MAG TPA: GAF domain-containing protein [Sphingobium sp.]|uniref:GAF domain-containing protein n=1 Tax=Sphingobium sp. TaxID=1912891 RepID=UPI002ED16F4A